MDFRLSPGITPFLADLFVLEIPLALGLAYALRRRPGVELVVALNALGLGAIKLVTDYADVKDIVVAIAGLVGGLVLLSWFGSAAWQTRRLVWFERVVAVGMILVGVYKAVGDFYDPFDLLLADMIVVSGVWILTIRGTSPRPAAA
jgi:hypothetical protein